VPRFAALQEIRVILDELGFDHPVALSIQRPKEGWMNPLDDPRTGVPPTAQLVLPLPAIAAGTNFLERESFRNLHASGLTRR
jgi:hypothetical protein